MSQLLAVARTWLKPPTPWRHQGRKKGVGVDCVGFISEVAREAGLLAWMDAANYRRRPDGVTLRAKMNEHLTRIQVSELAPGDVVLLATEDQPNHVALIGDYPVAGELSLIHAYLPARRVIEHRLDASWRAKIVGAYRIQKPDPVLTLVGKVVGPIGAARG